MKQPTCHADVWDTITYLGASGVPFTTGTVIAALSKSTTRTPKAWTLCWQEWKTWALANPNQFYGPASRLVKVRSGLYQLVDGDMTDYDQ